MSHGAYVAVGRQPWISVFALFAAVLHTTGYLTGELPGFSLVCSSHLCIGILGFRHLSSCPTFREILHGFHESRFKLSDLNSKCFYLLNYFPRLLRYSCCNKFLKFYLCVCSCVCLSLCTMCLQSMCKRL